MTVGRLDGLSMLVLGGGSGIGRAATLAYVREGAVVTVLERSPAAAADLEKSDARLSVLVGDATDAASIAAAVEAAESAAGRLDHLTCCVGAFDRYASLRTMSVDELLIAADGMWRINVLGTLVAIKLAHASLERSGGSVTLTLSESAYGSTGGGVLYGSAKSALRGVVSHLSADLAPEVRVNGVAPGGTSGTGFAGDDAERDTRIAAANRLHVTPTPEDHTAAYVYLADPVASRVVTGTVMHTDGGSVTR